MLKTKVNDPKLENMRKIETSPRLLHFSPKSLHIILGHFVVVSDQYGS